MTGWENSRSTAQRHEHTLITNAQGQDVCSSCHQIVFKPITSSDDPRLEEAGFMRSVHHEQEREPVISVMPLTSMLLWAYNETDGDFPVAYYMVHVINEHGRRGDISGDLWIDLSRKTES